MLVHLFSLVFSQLYLNPLETNTFCILVPQHAAIRTEILEMMPRVYDGNWFILGQELETFEKAYAQFSNSSFCVGVGNGLDAFLLPLKPVA